MHCLCMYMYGFIFKHDKIINMGTNIQGAKNNTLFAACLFMLFAVPGYSGHIRLIKPSPLKSEIV